MLWGKEAHVGDWQWRKRSSYCQIAGVALVVGMLGRLAAAVVGAVDTVVVEVAEIGTTAEAVVIV